MPTSERGQGCATAKVRNVDRKEYKAEPIPFSDLRPCRARHEGPRLQNLRACRCRSWVPHCLAPTSALPILEAFEEYLMSPAPPVGVPSAQGP